MKRIGFLSLLGLAMILSSSPATAQLLGKKKKAKAETPAPAAPDSSGGSVVPPGTASPAATVKKGDSLFISLERTPCFGHCPAYKIEIFYTGYVAYHGYSYVDRIGDFYTHISKDQLRALFDNAKDIKFFNLKDSYINSAISDFPTTITTMTVRGQQKSVIDGHNETPSELIFFEKMIDDLFKDTQWKAIPSKDQQ